MKPSRARAAFRIAVLALASVGVSQRALAQYRPPPLTEAQQLLRAGEAERVEAAALEARGDSRSAEARLKHALDLFAQAMARDASQVVPGAAGFGAAGNALREHAKVAERLSPVAAANPDAMEVAFPLGVALYKLRRYAEAQPLLERVARANAPEHFIVHYYLGTRALAEQRGEAAIAAYRQYLATRPKELAGNDAEIEEQLGRSHLLLGQAREARAAFERAQARRPEAIGVQMGLVAVLELEGKGKEAIAALEGLAKRFPKSPEPRERLGQLLLRAQDTTRAEAVAKQLLELQPNASAYLLLGRVHLAQKQAPRAEQELRKALELQPALGPAQLALAQALEQQGKNAESAAVLESALKSGNQTVELWAALGSISRRGGRYQRALEAHRNVVAMVPSQALGHLLLGADHSAIGQWDEAIEDYRRALELEPQSARARHLLALSLAQRARTRIGSGLPESAVPDLRRAFDLEHTVAFARALGAALLTQRAYGEARKTLEEGVKLPGAAWKEQLLLGYARLGAHDPPAALAAFEQAGKGTPDAAAASEAYAGWALTKLELGEYDTAVERLQTPGPSAAAAQVTQANLPLALARRALAKLANGDGAGALKDVEAGERVPRSEKDPEASKVLRLARALVQIDQGAAPEALGGLRRALAGSGKWASPETLPLLEAYLHYRTGDLSDARKRLAQAQRVAGPRKSEWSVELDRAIERRDGELAYTKGALPRAEKAFQVAAGQDPLNPFVIHNAACVQYRRGKADAAVQAWESVSSAVPESWLNLGIDAQERKVDAKRAVELFGRYIAANGAKAALAKEWKERLQSIHGVSP